MTLFCKLLTSLFLRKVQYSKSTDLSVHSKTAQAGSSTLSLLEKKSSKFTTTNFFLQNSITFPMFLTKKIDHNYVSIERTQTVLLVTFTGCAVLSVTDPIHAVALTKIEIFKATKLPLSLLQSKYLSSSFTHSAFPSISCFLSRNRSQFMV